MNNMYGKDGIPKRFKIHPRASIEVTSFNESPALEDLFNEEYMEDVATFHLFDYDQAAEDLLDSFNGHDCIAFLESIHKVAAKRIVEDWRKYSPERLEEEQYKKYLDYE